MRKEYTSDQFEFEDASNFQTFCDIPKNHLDISHHFEVASGKSTSRIISDNNLLSGLDGSGKTLMDRSHLLNATPINMQEDGQFEFTKKTSDFDLTVENKNRYQLRKERETIDRNEEQILNRSI